MIKIVGLTHTCIEEKVMCLHRQHFFVYFELHFYDGAVWKASMMHFSTDFDSFFLFSNKIYKKNSTNFWYIVHHSNENEYLMSKFLLSTQFIVFSITHRNYLVPQMLIRQVLSYSTFTFYI